MSEQNLEARLEALANDLSDIDEDAVLLREAAAELRRLTKLLETYAEHWAGCRWFNGGSCNCGLSGASAPGPE